MRLRDTGCSAEEIREMVSKYMIETYERFDFIAERGDGMYLYDENDVPYLDFYAGVAVNSSGNCNKAVVKAVQEQAAQLMQTFNYPYTIPQALLARKICTTIGMDKIFYQNTGTEANEAMIKMARKYGIEKYGPQGSLHRGHHRHHDRAGTGRGRRVPGDQEVHDRTPQVLR